MATKAAAKSAAAKGSASVGRSSTVSKASTVRSKSATPTNNAGGKSSTSTNSASTVVKAKPTASTPPTPKYRYGRNNTFPPAPPVLVNPRLLVGKGIMAYVNQTIPSQQSRILADTLFSKNHPERLLPGSVISVHLTHQPTLFSGVLISIRRKGTDTSFTLRNVVNRVGTELTFYIGSPHLKKIDIIQRAGQGGGGLGRRTRRAKYYFLRDSPEKMSQISEGIGR